MFKRFTALSAIIIIQTALAVFIGGAFLNGGSAGKILPGITSAGIHLGGMTPDEAEKKMREKFTLKEDDVLILEGEGRQWEIPMQDIGAFYDYRDAIDKAYSIGHTGPFLRRVSELLGNRTESVSVPLPLKFNQEGLKKELDRINREYSKSPQNARLIRENNKIKLISGEDGIEMDMAETLRRILNLQAGAVLRVMVASKPSPPEVSDKDISGLKDVLGECTTEFDSGSQERALNIARASVRLDGTLVKPGEFFSFNDRISPVNEQGGYYMAPAIIDEQLVEEYGGGVCQVSTTLYGAALLSGLEIVERYPHSRPVKYVPPGMDATVAEGLLDFRFRNNFSHPVYLIASAETGKECVKIIIIGKKEDNAIYKIETDVKTVSPGMVMKSSSLLKPGHSAVAADGSPGFEVSVYRVSVIEGEGEKRELISHDSYLPEPMIVEVGL